PVSYLDTPTEGQRLHSVSADNTAIAYDATRRMIALGHRRIAFVRFILYTLRGIDPDASERQAGFVKAMNEAGLDATGIYSLLPGRDRQHSLLALLDKKPRYTAALCTSMDSAAVLAGEMKALGREVPRDLSLCCVQGTYDRERISGAVLNFHDIAYRATLLLNRPKTPVIRERVSAVWQDRGTLVSC
ncbi:MAG: LacI family DNA-binding transcriptional regulator, partial [Planctomycetales bacterium]|nr:LacI family DNA-binding transcriptional regulator [Planctomycetales bacterium]